MNALFSLLAFLVAVAILITVHEFGHFLAARILGVRVLRFSVGFGRPLLRWQRKGGTEYAIAALPFGGYVKLLDEREAPVPEPERRYAFNRQPVWRRAIILIAGPGFNLVFAALAYWVVFMAGIPGLKPVIGPVVPHSPAARAGLSAREQILSVNGEQTPTWEAAQLALLSGVVDGRPIVLRMAQPEGATRTATLDYGDAKALTRPGALLSGLGLSAWMPPLAPVLAEVSPDGPAARAGLEAGDRIVAVDGKPVSDWESFKKIVRDHPGQRLELTVRRVGRLRSLPVLVGQVKERGQTIGHLGVGVSVPRDYARSLRANYRLGPIDALRTGVARTVQVTTLTAVMLYRMAIGEASLENLSGPIEIAHYAGTWAEAGAIPFLFFLALISVSLAILNVLPIPLLDGGQLFYLLIELVRGRPLSARAEAIGLRVGLGLLALLIGFVVFNDLSRLFSS